MVENPKKLLVQGLYHLKALYDGQEMQWHTRERL